ncbi:MaoC family dehydratase [Photobacterium atrarenae]|uniref:MaoC family dehydratase n=1 Tax=Photobacterium atrarenae TaxID=865757 RepID=A0ABY5GL53_9GAMM|nr:MaoC family dehydratase [Photobacterium atrarenae]UTV29658.1 MaoC family dehydratase [Photobacterium atrarenae]
MENGNSMMRSEQTSSLYLEDLAVGQEFLSKAHQLDAEQIIAFASEYDPQPFHLDPEAAEDTLFQGLAASGWHTVGITMKLLVQSIPLACGLIGVNSAVSWPRPARPGDILRVKSRIVEIKPSQSRPDRAIVQIHSLTLNGADEVVQELTAKLMVFRK